MDNQNTLEYSRSWWAGIVLILVLMDNQNTHASNGPIDHIHCLNPCSNG